MDSGPYDAKNDADSDSMCGNDDKCVHAIALIGSEPVGTGRLIKLSSSKAQIGRMAVLHEFRRLQIGTKILKKLEKPPYILYGNF